MKNESARRAGSIFLRLLALFAAGLCLLNLGACSRSDAADSAIDTPKVARLPLADLVAAGARDKALAASLQDFGLRLHQNVMKREGNLAFSPYSISSALAMVKSGAAGETERQLAEVLGVTDFSGKALDASHALLMERLMTDAGTKGAEGPLLKISNGLFPQTQYPILPEYLNRVQSHYQAAIQNLDFVGDSAKAVKRINDWISQNTEKRIANLLSPSAVDADTRMILVNAVYFLGPWESRFESKSTSEQPFYLDGGAEVKVPLMTRLGAYNYTMLQELLALELPYKGGEFSMLVLLPREKGKLSELEESLTAERLDEVLASLRNLRVLVYLPRFKLSARLGLKESLGEMGIKDAFDMKADFSGMTGNQELFLSDVFHQTFVEVKEEGTEAAAATAAVVRQKSIDARVERPIEFRADHPFLFIIRHRPSGAVLFMGRVSNPTVQ
jgi:serpin B